MTIHSHQFGHVVSTAAGSTTLATVPAGQVYIWKQYLIDVHTGAGAVGTHCTVEVVLADGSVFLIYDSANQVVQHQVVTTNMYLEAGDAIVVIAGGAGFQVEAGGSILGT